MNLQNIPSHNKDIRKMFVATQEEKVITTETQQFEVDRWCEIECPDGWKFVDKLSIGDKIKDTDGNFATVINLEIYDDKVIIDFT